MKASSEPTLKKSLTICNYAARILHLRLQENLSQEVLAEKAGISRKTLSRLENGDDGIKCRTIYAIFKALGISVCKECVGCRDDLREQGKINYK